MRTIGTERLPDPQTGVRTVTGRLYVFEGPDGVGKTSLCQHTQELLVQKGQRALLARFPGRQPGTLGELVYRIHHNRKEFGLSFLTHAALQALHVAAHIDTIERTILPALSRGEHVIMDRYWWSTLAYGSAAGVNEDLLKALVEGEIIAWGNHLPTRLFYVTRKTGKDTEEPFVQAVKAYYAKLIAQESQRYEIQEIENDSSIQEALAKLAPNLI